MKNPTEANERLFRQAMERAVGRLRGGVLVDLGSGDGQYSKELGKLMRASKVVGVDHEPILLKQAQKLGLCTIVADLNGRLPLAAGTVAVVVANQVIEHVTKTDVLAAEMWRILVPGGRAVVCTPNLASWHNVVALAAAKLPFSMQVSDRYYLGNNWHPLHRHRIMEKQAHLRVFTPSALRELLWTHGFEQVEVTGIGFYPFGGKLAEMLSKLDNNHSAYLLAVGVKSK